MEKKFEDTELSERYRTECSRQHVTEETQTDGHCDYLYLEHKTINQILKQIMLFSLNSIHLVASEGKGKGGGDHDQGTDCQYHHCCHESLL